MNFTLYHYYDEDTGPFQSLSKLPIHEAVKISERLRREGNTFAGKRTDDYLMIRKELERVAREKFIDKGGKPQNSYPHYMTLEKCDWLESWYRKPAWISINWNEFSEDTISFTYGDLFPTMRYQDNKSYRRQVYTKNEIIELIEEYGMPQDWNSFGDNGPERYIEVQIWDEVVIKRFCKFD